MSRFKNYYLEIILLLREGSVFLFYLGFQLTRYGLSTLGKAIDLTQSTNLNGNPIQNTHTEIPRTTFDQFYEHPLAQSRRNIKLAVTLGIVFFSPLAQGKLLVKMI